VAGLLLRPGIFASLVPQPRLDPAFPVPFLPAHNLPHQFSLAGLVHRVRVSAWLATGTAWRRFPLTHHQILLQLGILAQRLARNHYPGSAGTAHTARRVRGLGHRRPGMLGTVDKAPVPVRDLTDAAQNQAVLEVASALAGGGAAGERAMASYGPAVAAEAAAAARSRRRLGELPGPVHLTVVWAMYGETGRMVPRAVHPHGEDFVRVKVGQLDWLTGGLPGRTWSIIACDDGCPDRPTSADLMAGIAAAEGYPAEGHRSVTVLRLAEVIAGGFPVSPAFGRLTSTGQSRKGGSILAALAAAIRAGPARANGAGRHVVCYTDADLSANLAQLGSLAAPVVAGGKVAGALGQRYGIPGAVLVRPDGPVTEPQSTGGKPDKIIILFRHFVRALLIPALAHVPDTQAGFKAFDAAALGPVIGQMTSFNETFDVELLIHLAQRYGSPALAVEPIVFTEDFAATNFPSVAPGPHHLAMIHQIVELYDRLIAPVTPATGAAADLLALIRTLGPGDYVTLIEHLRAEDPGDPTLFDRRWPVQHLREILHR
jgi:hypothetical protein